MKESTSREKVLKAVRKALIHKSEADFSAADSEAEIYSAPEEESLELLFAKNFSGLTGNFIFCEKREDFIKSISEFVKEKQWDDIFCADEVIHDMLKQASVPYLSE